ncbi:DUF3304 domain-containing protein [Ralstonia sp. 24A2]|uniref:DUF3304 domain-containing protein n=1 Tax=Ralstonia sp. 24A2 TaxID=3447364 RepID=UPI003F69B6A8
MQIPKPWLRNAGVVLGAGAVLALAWWAYDWWHAGTRRATASIVPYNHTHTTVDNFYVDGTWGGISDAKTGGGRSLCCVMIPERWHDRLQVTVKWQLETDPDSNWHEKRVDVPRYDEPGELQVHFYGGDTVKVVITNWDLRSPNNPLHDEWTKEKD